MTGAALLAVALALGVGDGPYERSRTDTQISSDPIAHCLWWGEAELTFVQDSAGNPETTGDTEFEAARQAMGSWAQVNDSCGHLVIREGAQGSFRTLANDGTNILVYRMRSCSGIVPQTDPCWGETTCGSKYDCWDGARGTIALTTTSYDVDTGQIYDSDIELNGASFVFTTVNGPACVHPVYDQNCVATDVQNTLTHELGHALGLDHTTNSGSTMNPSAPAGETSKRSIDVGTANFICDVYPQGAPARDCVIEPYGGTLGEAHGCGATGGLPLVFGALGTLWWASRRRRG